MSARLYSISCIDAKRKLLYIISLSSITKYDFILEKYLTNNEQSTIIDYKIVEPIDLDNMT